MAKGMVETFRRPGINRRVLTVIGQHHGITFRDLVRECNLPENSVWAAATEACFHGLAHYAPAEGYRLMKRGRRIVRNEPEAAGVYA